MSVTGQSPIAYAEQEFHAFLSKTPYPEYESEDRHLALSCLARLCLRERDYYRDEALFGSMPTNGGRQWPLLFNSDVLGPTAK